MKNVERKLHKIDAEGKTIGRLASSIANILRGKNKPEFEPHLDLGDMVEVVNIGKAKFTGKKMDQKKYFSYSGYLGGLKEKKLKDVFTSNPGEVLRRAVREMLAPTKMRKDIIKRLIIR
ncbi:50S ribosomal protein L13 [Candidatus Falkowbacteria bacterium HGW-Falkowbacteria-1]|uniref:Large ribosomal subunit protein uL13 n=1 Tax=Candidatus Falkowbacteria bacterium HGW-Falkowbacteria-1 TaxID=2013768 RepID=A0A2N2E9M9_9BACT|nr:MAG: 50S ribosomal protein L13 [Candidatus Falkowbacteria bacterium HGW-Falkowbacteria-1]